MKVINLYIERICSRCGGKYDVDSSASCVRCFGQGTIKEIIRVVNYKEIDNV